jgi:hypothetical protein
MTTDPTPVPLIGKAWQEGYEAGKRGLPGAANPYPLGTDASIAWHSGRFKGQTKTQRPAKERKNLE